MNDVAAHIDFETRSAVDLRRAGAHAYARHPSTSIWMLSWRVGDGWVERWHPGDEWPWELLEHIEQGRRVVAHNAAFERVIWNIVLRQRMELPWPELRIEQQDCTMARAAAVHLPQGLDDLGTVLALPTVKDKEGHSLMLKMCRPRKVNEDGTFIWWDDPANIERLGTYCDDDVRAETGADNVVPALSPSERQLWELDQRINDRGFGLDVRSIEAAIAIVSLAQKSADRKMVRLTNGAVQKCSQAARLVEWLCSRGIETATVAKHEQEDLIIVSEMVGDEDAKAAIELRREASKASTAKLKAMLKCVCPDNRARGLFRYHGAGPGRWTASIVQPHNFPRVDEDDDLPAVLDAFEVMNNHAPEEAHELLDLSYGQVIPLISKCLRGMIVADPGNKLVGADYRNIEGRVNAWIAGEDWKLQAFREYDAGVGPDLYKLAYSKSFGIDLAEIKKWQRQIGKVEELSLGYQGSVGAFISMGVNYGLKPDDVLVAIKGVYGNTEAWTKTAAQYDTAKNKFRLSRDQWTALKMVVDAFRSANPKITQSWWDLQDAAIEATASPGGIVRCVNDKVGYLVAMNVLWCQLPSGRVLAYHRPRVVEVSERVPIFDEDGEEVDEWTRTKRMVEYEGIHPKTKKWSQLRLYGGLQCNNVVQGTARDILVNGMDKVEEAGYPDVLHVHDEAVAEVAQEFGSPEHFGNLMSILPPWAQGLPVSVKAWEHQRYVK